MALLFDTTALSELNKPRPNAGFVFWLSQNIKEDTFIGAPSIAELEFGIALLDKSKKRTLLERWLNALITEYGERILPFDMKAAVIWGRAIAAAQKAGQVMPGTDAQIAAIAVTYDLTLVTRNVRHFNAKAFDGLEVVNPWK